MRACAYSSFPAVQRRNSSVLTTSFSGFKFSQLEMSELYARCVTYSPLFTVTIFRDRALHSRVELPVLALADQAHLLELCRHRVPGHRPRVLEARDDTQCQPCVSLNYAMDGQCMLGWNG